MKTKRRIALIFLSLSALAPLACTAKSETSSFKSKTDLGGNSVKIRNIGTSLCLENFDYGGWNGKKIIQAGCKSNKTQKWQLHFKADDNGVYVIRPEAGGDTVVDVIHENSKDSVQLWKYNEANRNQMWWIIESGIQKYTIRSVALPKKCLGFPKDITKDQSQLELLDCNLSKGQIWTID
jgi:hypothetical protein